MAGFVKLDRSILSWGWYKDPNTMRVFVHLLLLASYRESEFMGVTIHRGQVATSYASIADDLSLSIQNVRTAINHLKSTGEVTGKPYPKFQVISIVNYDRYQGELTGKPTVIQQASNNIQEIKNKRNNIAGDAEDLPPWQQKLLEELKHG